MVRFDALLLFVDVDVGTWNDQTSIPDFFFLSLLLTQICPEYATGGLIRKGV